MNKSLKSSISIDELTTHFIKFAKIMQLMPKLYSALKLYCECYHYCGKKLNFWNKKSFYEYAKIESRSFPILNDSLIMKVYFFCVIPHYNKICGYDLNIYELVNLFFSYLKDYGYTRYIKVER